MEQRDFGRTGLPVSLIGFGAWGIGGPAMAGRTAIGWGTTDDTTSVAALKEAHHRGVTFFDTADFYGLGHSEELIGRTFGNASDIIVATKVGHRADPDGSIATDYSKAYILRACEASLRRLRRERVDLYQLHSARVAHFTQGECIEAMEQLKREGKIRSWGVSLNTFHPEPEAEYLMERKLGDGFQLVLNVINQRALPLLKQMGKQGYGVIARMPLQFGLLTGKFNTSSRFTQDDHRSYRLTPEVLRETLESLTPVWQMAERRGISPTALALSYCASFPEVSTIIPGIKTPEQARTNTTDITALPKEDLKELKDLYEEKLKRVVEVMEQKG